MKSFLSFKEDPKKKDDGENNAREQLAIDMLPI